MHDAATRREFLDGVDVEGFVHALELLARGQRRLDVDKMIGQTGGDQLILHRRQALRTLGMHGAHVVQLAVGVRYECGAHVRSPDFGLPY